MNPKIGILTTFCGSDEAYSLVNVVRTHIEMMLADDYDPALLVASNWTTSDEFWNGKKFRVIPTAHPDDKADTIVEKLRPVISQFDVILCHDIVFLTQHREWAAAIRVLAKEMPNISWIHFQHSRGDGLADDVPPVRSWFGYPNRGDLAHCATYNRVSLDRVRYIPHPLDFRYLGWSNLATRIADETGYIKSDVACILPARLDHQKQVDKLIRLMAGIKKAGRSVTLLIADAYATGEPFLTEKKNLHQVAKEQDFDQNLTFLGEKYPDCYVSTPRNVVKALYEMGNIFVLPSNAETSSLVAMEAALAGNLLVLNEDFSPILHLYKKAVVLPFGSVLVNDRKYWRNIKTADGESTQVEDAQLFWDDQAKQIVLPALDSQLIQLVKRQQVQERWPGIVWKEHLLPLIEEATRV